MQKATIFFSDLHPDDIDFTRPDVNGVKGEDLFRAFLDWSWRAISRRFELTLVCNGDGVNCVPYLAEALVGEHWVFSQLAAINAHPHASVVFIPGNHDKRLTGCKLLNYHTHAFKAFCGGTVWAEHGHSLDRAWSKKGVLNTWLGEHVIKRGTQIEHRWPLADEVFLRAGRFFIPKGHDGVSDDKFIAESMKMAEADSHLKKFCYGHTHRALYHREDGITVVNTHSWVPSPSSHPEGWYVRGEVSPFLYWAELDSFLKVEPDGMTAYAGTTPSPF